MIHFVKYLFLFAICWTKSNGFAEKNWLFHSPEGTAMGLFLALALPIDYLNKNVYLSYNFEVNYPLPGNSSSDVEYPPLVQQNQERKSAPKIIDRSFIFNILKLKINQFGYDGHNCLLKLICEFSKSILVHNGVLSDILHIIFMPTSSTRENINADYFQAEMRARTNKCSNYNCAVDILSTVFS